MKLTESSEPSIESSGLLRTERLSESVKQITQITCLTAGFHRALLYSIKDGGFYLIRATFPDDSFEALRIELEAPSTSMDKACSVAALKAIKTGFCEVEENPDSLILQQIGLESAVIAPLRFGGRSLGLLAAGPAAATEARLNAQMEALRAISSFGALAFRNIELERTVAEQQTLFDIIPIPLGIATSPDCRDIRVNEAFARILNLEKSANASKSADADERPMNFIVTHKGRELAADELPMQIAASKGMTIREFEESVVWSDGTRFDLLAWAAPTHDEEGNIRGSVGAFVDITARKKAEETVLKSRAMLEFLVAGIHDTENVLGILAKSALSFTKAEGVVVALFEPMDNTLVIQSALGLEDTLPSGLRVRISNTLAEQVLKAGVYRVLNDTTSVGAFDLSLAGDKPVRSLAAIPIMVEGVPRGLIQLLSPYPESFDSDAVDLLKWLAHQAEAALKQAEAYNRERTIVQTFQDTLLTEPEPALPGYEIATVYQAALKEPNIGGDFYDFVSLKDGQLGVMVGDVSGKGLRAAVVTAKVKFMMRAYAHHFDDIERALALLNNALFQELSAESFITMALAVVDNKTNTIKLFNAGHEPAILLRDGLAELVEAVGMPPLGLKEDTRYQPQEIGMQPGDCLLLYTDGFSEARRDRDFLDPEGLAAIAGERGRHAAEDLVSHIFSRVNEFSRGRQRDDMVMVALKRKQ